MKKPASGNEPDPKQERPAISEITVGGFKSIRDEQTVEIRPLTILAGPNSSGKSSIMQPLLLMKQTVEEDFVPESALILNGSHLKLGTADELFSIRPTGKRTRRMVLGASLRNEGAVRTYLGRDRSVGGLKINRTDYHSDGKLLEKLTEGMDDDEIRNIASRRNNLAIMRRQLEQASRERVMVTARPYHCFLCLSLSGIRAAGSVDDVFRHDERLTHMAFAPPAVLTDLLKALRKVLHVSHNRASVKNAYPAAQWSSLRQGTLEKYTGAAIYLWQVKETKEFKILKSYLQKLRLASDVRAERITSGPIEVKVAGWGSGISQSPQKFFHLSNVGCAVGSALPVLVALTAAQPGELTYLEHPEMDLHPQAQVAMAEVIADAARRGVRVVVETHSSLLLLAVQTLVAEGKLDADLVKLHWFSLDNEGATRIHSGELDETGAFGDWPEDFGAVEASADNRYLDAAERRLMGG